VRRPLALLVVLSSLLLVASAEAAPVTAEEVAGWVLSGDDADLERAATALDAATRAFRREVLAALRARAGLRPVPPGPAPAPQAAAEGPLVTIEGHFLEVDPRRAREVLGDLPGPEAPARLLPRDQAEALLAAGAPGVKVLTAPRLTTLDGREGEIRITNQTAYVKDFEVKEGEGGATTVSPVVDTIEDGFVLAVVPRLSPDLAVVHLEVRVSVSELARPIPEVVTRVAGREVRVQVPELRVTRVRAEASVPAEGFVLLGGLGEGPDGTRLVVLRARVVIAGEAPAVRTR